jgi:hypothetical protein
LGVSPRGLNQAMALPDPEGFRMHANKACNNAYCVKRFLLHTISFLTFPQTKSVNYFKNFFELFSNDLQKRLCRSDRNSYRVKYVFLGRIYCISK